MNIIDQKLGNVGDVHLSIVAGKLILGVDAGLDLAAQLQKLADAHSSGLLGELLKDGVGLVAKIGA